MSEQMRFVAMQECADGNESVGTEWVEAAGFAAGATLRDVWLWAQGMPRHNGRLMIVLDTGPVEPHHPQEPQE